MADNICVISDSSATARRYFELDAGLGEYFPDFLNAELDLILLISKTPSSGGQQTQFFGEGKENVDLVDPAALIAVLRSKRPRSILMIGFDRKHFDYISGELSVSAEAVYLFKCPRIGDLSALSSFSRLKCLCVFRNDTLTKLWDMSHNRDLLAVSLISAFKLDDIDALKNSPAEYFYFDSIDNSGKARPLLFDKHILDLSPHLKHYRVYAKDVRIEK